MNKIRLKHSNYLVLKHASLHIGSITCGRARIKRLKRQGVTFSMFVQSFMNLQNKSLRVKCIPILLSSCSLNLKFKLKFQAREWKCVFTSTCLLSLLLEMFVWIFFNYISPFKNHKLAFRKKKCCVCLCCHEIILDYLILISSSILQPRPRLFPLFWMSEMRLTHAKWETHARALEII